MQLVGLTASESEKANQRVIDSSAEVIDALGKRYDREIKLAQAAGKETIFLEIEKRKAQLKTIDDVVKALIAKGVAEGELNDEELKKINDLKQQKIDIETDLQATILTETRKNNEKRDQENQKSVERSKSVAAEKKKIEADRLAAELKNQEEISDLVNQLMQENIDEAQKIADDAEKAKIDALVKATEDRIKIEDALFANQQDLFLTAQQKEIQAVVEKYEKLNELAIGNAEAEKQIVEQRTAELKAIKDRDAAEDLQRQKQLEAQKIQFVNDGIGALANLVGSFSAKNEAQAKKQFQVSKALNIAQALVQTYQSATAAFASQVIPGDPSSVVRGQIAAGIAVATGLAQVNKIRQTKFGSGSGGGSSSGGSGGGGALGSPSGSGEGQSGPPTFNPINTAFLQNRPPQAAPTYVIAGTVTNAQQADQKINELARL